jgi:beta-fructofuranosidase
MDLHRPIYHFLPEKNWMNDPNGTIFYKGEHHLFYQYNPYGYKWDHMHWGHAKSKDLIHWERLPIALYPSNELGELHCFSGCCVLNEGEPTIFYTSIGENERNPAIGAQQWMATSNDDMLTWQKHPGNPILDIKCHGDMEIKEWRDPFIWKENNTWFMVLAGTHGKEGCILIYSSEDLMNWKYLNKFYKEDDVILECPNVVVFGKKYLLVYSVIEEQQVKYCLGTMQDDYTLHVEQKGCIDYGKKCYYATNISFDDKDRILLWGWLNESARGELPSAGEWSGIQSLPRILELKGDNALGIKPIPEIKAIRGQHFNISNITLQKETRDISLSGKAIEIQAEFESSENVKDFGIKLLCSPDGREETVINFNIPKKVFSIDRSKSSLSQQVSKDTQRGSYKEKNGIIKVHVLVDYSCIEVFVNDEVCMSARVYPLLEESNLVKIYSDGKIKVNQFDIWELKSIW